MKARPLVYIITGADMYLHAVTRPEESRYRSDERESVSYVLFKYFCVSINFMLARLASDT